MARLIDADALNKELQQRVGSPTDDKLYEANLVIIEAQTIDAIPVEWLRDKMRGYASSLKSTEMDAVVMVMQMWQKEQEAQK